MNTAKRAYKKFYKAECNGKHEITYLLWETIDELSSDNDLSGERLDLLKEKLEWLETLVMDRGVKQARKEMAIIGVCVVALCGSIYFGRRKFEEYKSRVEEALKNE